MKAGKFNHPCFEEIIVSQLKILIVDDQKDVADSMTGTVSRWGYEVKTGYSGEEALKIAKEFDPHVVLLDVMMPGMDGYKVALELRRQATNEITVIGVTALGDEEHRHQGYDSGFHWYMTKPVEPEKLQKVLAGLQKTLEIEFKSRERRSAKNLA